MGYNIDMVVNVELFIPKRPETVVEQLRTIINNTNSKWILISATDVKLLKEIPRDFDSMADFISFFWKNVPAIYSRENFGIGLVRVSKLKQLFLEIPNLPSEGLELYFEKYMKTEYSKIYGFIHENNGLSLKAMYRYGKGRAYYNKQIRRLTLPQTKFKITYIHLYVAHIIGQLVGYVSKTTDNSW